MPSTVFRVPGPVSIGIGGGPTDLGVSKNGCIIRIQTLLVPVTDDAHGNAPADQIYAGKSAQVECLGVEPAQLGVANLFTALDGLGANTSMIAQVGKLVSTVAVILTVTQKDAALWVANKAFVQDPDNLALLATQEEQVPLLFHIVPDDADKLFVTVPAELL